MNGREFEKLDFIVLNLCDQLKSESPPPSQHLKWFVKRKKKLEIESDSSHQRRLFYMDKKVFIISINKNFFLSQNHIFPFNKN